MKIGNPDASPEMHESWDGHWAFEDFVRCPWCGELDEERTDYPSSLRHDGDEVEWDCSHCKCPFTVTMCVSYSFASKPLFIGPKRDFAHWCEVRRQIRESGIDPDTGEPSL